VSFFSASVILCSVAESRVPECCDDGDDDDDDVVVVIAFAEEWLGLLLLVLSDVKAD